MNRSVRVALIAGLLAAGCAVQPGPNVPTPTSGDPLGLGDAVAARYTTLAATASSVAIADVATSSAVTGVTATASSDRNPAWFAVSNLMDGNLHSAWSPAGSDASPTITLSLGEASRLTGLGIKMDAGATFDVAVNDGGTWTTIATDVSPEYRALDFVTLTPSMAQQVRLTFHVQPKAQLLVCDVKLFTGGAASSPSPVPSVAPSPQPSATPSAGTCLRIEGVGFEDAIDRAANRLLYGNRFYFEDVTVSGDTASGVFLIGDAGSGPADFLVSSVVRTGDTVTLQGTNVDETTKATVVLKVTSETGGTFKAMVSQITVVAIATGATVFTQAFPDDSQTFALDITGETGVCPVPSTVPPSACFEIRTQEGGSTELSTENFYPNEYVFNNVRATASGYAGTFTNDGASFEIPTYRVTSIVQSGDTITVTGVPLPTLDRLGNPGLSGYASVKETITITSRNGDQFTGYVSRSERTGFDAQNSRTLTFNAEADNGGVTHSNISFSGSLGACR